ncbi:MAG: RNA methyltransferase [Bacteroidales bacterium]|nr:RNA methyltransferase [Bacteroidales bacterium]
MFEEKTEFKLVAKTLAGLEEPLFKELKDIGAEDLQILHRAVQFTGNKELMYKANLCCRTALRILKPIKEFIITNEDELYKGIYAIKWNDFIDSSNTLSVDAVNSDSFFKNTLYISQKCKDAIVDRFNNITGKRPSVNIENPDLRINVFINKDLCTVSLDSSGMSLHKRGYRQYSGEAPLNEVLAAGLILLSDWQKDCNFIDPMCGSGTLLIEAAMIALDIPAGYYRKEFAFQRWRDYEPDLWNKVYNDAIKNIKEFDYNIYGSDLSFNSIDIAKKNIRSAKLHKDIDLLVKAFEEYEPPAEKGIIIMNPPYGERLKQNDIIAFYKSIGDVLKSKYAGYKAYIISSDKRALKFIGLKPSKKIKIFNGQLECLFVRFELYEGSKRF